MENLAHFIHEELFLVSDSANQAKQAALAPMYKVGIVAVGADKDDELLLNDILKAIKIDRKEIILAEEPSESSPCWLIFSDTFLHNGTQIHPTVKIEMNAKRLILAHPLKALRDSKQEKAALWLILKDEFGV